MREIGVMVVPDNNKSIFSKNFKLRVFSTIFILPIPIIIIWNGSWIFVGFLALLSFIALTEWNKLIGIYSANLRSQIPSFLTVCSIIVVAILGYRLGLMTLLLACLSSLIISRDERSSVLLSMFGPAYVFLPCCCFLWLREVPVYGLHMVFWLLVVVSTMDICAYLFGRLIKGPKLAPKISPGKTWSGLISGVFCATSVGGFIGHHMFDFQLFLGNWKWAMALALLVSVFAQIGDLGESWLKRQMHVKDSGNLIPGHGGLLDRVDGFMLSAPLMVIFILCLT